MVRFTEEILNGNLLYCAVSPTDDSHSDSLDDEVPLEGLMNATNIPISTSKNTLAGSSRPPTQGQNESSLGKENANDENSLGNKNVAKKASCSTSTVKKVLRQLPWRKIAPPLNPRTNCNPNPNPNPNLGAIFLEGNCSDTS